MDEKTVNEIFDQASETMTDTQASEILMTLEEAYPHLNRLPEWKLVGFENHKNTGRQPVPVWMYTWYEKNKKYSGENLRKLRKERGVGKPPKTRNYSMSVKS